MTLAVAAAVAAAIALPHHLPLSRVAPMLGASIWLFALTLRALACVFAAMFVLFSLPATRLFEVLTHWCWHAVLPLVGTHLPLEGHRLGDTATLLPGLFLAVSTLSVVWALMRTAHAVHKMLRRHALAGGPMGSVIVPDGDVLVAAAGLRRPTVVVSAGALCAFDDEELAASVDHERGHIVRHHRFLLVLGELCRTVGRFVPGAAPALGQLHFHLERDADEYALARQHDPLALASAICKAAGASTPIPAALALEGDGDVVDRLRLLTSGSPRGGRALHSTAMVLAVAMIALAIDLTAALTGVADPGDASLLAAAPVVHCPA
jgi:hypothetical protein